MILIKLASFNKHFHFRHENADAFGFCAAFPRQVELSRGRIVEDNSISVRKIQNEQLLSF